MAHQVEQDFVFALKVVIQPAFTELQRGGHIIHGSGIIALLLKKTGSGAENFLAGTLCDFTWHGDQYDTKLNCVAEAAAGRIISPQLRPEPE